MTASFFMIGGPSKASSPSCAEAVANAAVNRKRNYWFYEIKIAESARACIREALGQLLEYAFWRAGHAVTPLIIVGEHGLDADARAYLHRLRKKTKLPLQYEQIK